MTDVWWPERGRRRVTDGVAGHQTSVPDGDSGSRGRDRWPFGHPGGRDREPRRGEDGATGSTGDAGRSAASDWTDWSRPVENPVFTTRHGNNRDAILFVDPDLAYPCRMIVGHGPAGADLWRTDQFHWHSVNWELVSGQYELGGTYEYDDAVNVDGTYYVYESGDVFAYSGTLEEADGNWHRAGSFPQGRCDDVGVYYEDGVFHLFGEYGDFPHGYDGTSLSHLRSPTGLGEWETVDTAAVDPNPDGSRTYGVGDPTITKVDGTYYLYCDRESREEPYRVVGWSASSPPGRWTGTPAPEARVPSWTRRFPGSPSGPGSRDQPSNSVRSTCRSPSCRVASSYTSR